MLIYIFFFFFQAEDGIRDTSVTGVQTCALPIYQLHVALPSRLKGAGTVPLVVRADGIESNKATLTITDGGAPPRPTRIEITPATATIPVGGEMHFDASAFDSLGDEIENAVVAFASSDTNVA